MNRRNKCSENLQKFREQKNLSRKEMAKALGYSVYGYQKIEQGQRGIPVSKAMLAAEILDCSLYEIYPPVGSEDCL